MNDIPDTLNKMTGQLTAMAIPSPYIIGIHTGGLWIAEKIHQALHCQTPLGVIDISFHRDDFSRVGLQPEIKSSTIPCSVNNRTIVLVDDVLYTGRTIRAAMNEIFSYGRPDAIILAVLIDRGERELPIAADIVGQVMTAPKHQQVKLNKINNTLRLDIIDHRG